MRRTAFIPMLTVLMVGLSSCVTSPSSGLTETGAADMQAWSVEMRSTMNAHRAAAGVAPLMQCKALDAAAWNHSRDQATRDKLSHTGSNGSDPAQRMKAAGYQGATTWGENIAAGQTSVASVMSSWMRSQSHRDTILSPNFTHIGLGLAISADNTPYWTQDFGAGGSC